MITFEELKDTKNYFTEKLSDINRYLSFTGIAVIWLFRSVEISGIISLPNQLSVSLVFLVIALLMDLFQYMIGSILWIKFYRKKERKIERNKKYKKGEIEKVTFFEPEIYSICLYILFTFKVLLNLIGFGFLIFYILGLIQ